MGFFYMDVEFERIRPEIPNGDVTETPDFEVKWDRCCVWSSINAMQRWVGVEADVTKAAGKQLLHASKATDANAVAFDDLDSKGQTLVEATAESIREAATAFVRHTRATVAPYAGGFGLAGPLIWQVSKDDAKRFDCDETNLKFDVPREPARRKYTHISPEDFEQIQTSLKSGAEIPASFSFFSIAQDLFERRSNGPATIALVVAAETGLKDILARDSDVAAYLLEEVPSPPTNKLAAAAERYCGVPLDSDDRQVLEKLYAARNHQIHKSVTKKVTDKQLMTWFEVVEKIMLHQIP